MSFRASLLRPAADLIAEAGGVQMRHDGDALDPTVQFLATRPAPPLSSLPPEVARRRGAAGARLTSATPPATVAIEDRSIRLGDRQLDVRTYRAARDGALPGLIYLHGGGYVVGDLDTSHAFCAELADAAGCVVVSVAYRLAPETPFPAAFDDGVAAFQHVAADPQAWGIDGGQLGLGGDSAGGGLAAAVALSAAGVEPAFLLLIYPWLDLAAPARQPDLRDRYGLLDQADLAAYAARYLGAADPLDVRASALRAPSLAALPPTAVLVGLWDVLREQAEALHARAADLGLSSWLTVFPGLPHGFAALGGVSDAAARACTTCGLELARLIRFAADRPVRSAPPQQGIPS